MATFAEHDFIDTSPPYGGLRARQTMTSSSSHWSSDYGRFRRRLLLGFLTVAALAVAALGWNLRAAHAQRQHTAQAQTQALAHAIGAHVTDSIRLVDYALAGFVKDFSELAPGRASSAPALHALLQSHSPISSDDFLLLFIDPAGRGVASAGAADVAGVTFAERDYFRALAGGGRDPGLYVGEPVRAKVLGRPILTLSRRVLDGQGRFAGVVVAAMDARHLANMFDNARFHQDMLIALVHRNGKMVARVPLFAQSFGASVAASPAYAQMRRGPPGGYLARSELDGVARLYSAHPLDPLPLDVVAGVPLSTLNQALWDDLGLDALRLAVLAAVMLASAHFALKSYRELAQAREALQESEFRWRFALEGAGESVWDWNITTDALHLSPRWKQMMGYPEDLPDGTLSDWRTQVHPDDLQHALDERRAYASRVGGPRVSEYRVRCQDGSWKWIISRGMVIARDEGGRALRALGTHADITERKHAEQAQVHRVVEAAVDPMLLVGADGRIAFANAAALKTFGYELEQLDGRQIGELVPAALEPAALEPAGAAGERGHSGRRRDGRPFPVEVSLSPFQMNRQPVVIVHIRDLSAARHATEMLQRSFTQLRQLSDHQEQIKEAERKRIAQDIHDDLGQNLLALKMDVAPLRARVGPGRLRARVQIVLDNIDASIASVRAIMNDLRPAMLELGLHPAVAWQIRQFERMSGIGCVLSAPSAEAEFGLDEEQTLAVFRILQESLSNVARHAQASAVQIALAAYPGGFSMTVADNGRGLQPGDRRKDNSFGLMGIRERVLLLGGELTITSSPGSGTVLLIAIPLGAADSSA
jgi:two-component system, NarL family, sensor histidine kinase UhpB